MAKWSLTLAAVFASLSLVARGAAPQSADARQERLRAAIARVYDTGILHRIEIEIAADDARTILNRTTERVRCTFTFDGVVLKDVGVRQAGGVYHPYLPISNKPSLSVEFDEFMKVISPWEREHLLLHV